jgi:predicted nuclease of predicted toxin-antitoxin system
MLLFLADEDFNNHIVRGLRRRLPSIDLVRVQDVGLEGSPDSEVLEWAATAGRLLLTHDAETMIAFAKERIATGLPMPGVVEVSQDLPIGEAIAEIQLFAECSLDSEWDGQIIFLPL